ncbi:hypothetical protein D3C84_890820 [compost metagenome]
MALHLVQRKGQFGDCLMLAYENGEVVRGLQELELTEEVDCLNTVTMRFVMVPGGIVLGEPQKAATTRIDEMVAAAKAEINEMAAKAKAKILGNQISISLPGVTDAREVREAAAAVRRAVARAGRYT